MQFGSIDIGEGGEYEGVGLVEISNIFMEGDEYWHITKERGAVMEFQLNYRNNITITIINLITIWVWQDLTISADWNADNSKQHSF